MATVTNRKLIKFGTGIVVTLPKAWTDYYHLKPGDKVKVLANKGLIIKPNKNK
jgi:antitoxin component of MazEF toxin-antitoxin module